ncbi:MAG: HAD family hydrolase [Paracoccaceae bacterium]
MTKALLFGAIGTLAETSDIQRRAFNEAFAEAGLDWEWSEPEYRAMLRRSGGKNRIEAFAAARGEAVDAAALHAAKVRRFEALVTPGSLPPRPGVTELIAEARKRGWKLGFATSTLRDQVDLVLRGLGDTVRRDDFDWVGDASQVDDSKPAPDIYFAALDALAIEDTPPSAQAAMAAGLRTVALPGPEVGDAPFPEGVEVVERLTPALLDGPTA